MASYTNINVSPFSLLWEKYMLEFFVPIEKACNKWENIIIGNVILSTTADLGRNHKYMKK